ncbi:hypothetical protein ABPG72_015228 [Tetrahymena utriculariae]
MARRKNKKQSKLCLTNKLRCGHQPNNFVSHLGRNVRARKIISPILEENKFFNKKSFMCSHSLVQQFLNSFKSSTQNFRYEQLPMTYSGLRRLTEPMAVGQIKYQEKHGQQIFEEHIIFAKQIFQTTRQNNHSLNKMPLPPLKANPKAIQVDSYTKNTPSSILSHLF